MFTEMRSELGIPKSVDILDHIYTLPTPEEQEMAHEKIRIIERRAMLLQKPQAGVLNLMRYLDERKIRKGICTRNFDTPVNHLIDNFLQGHLFEPIITREFRPPKPDPAGILHIAREWGLPDGSNLIMVGDSIDDMTAGYKAGAATVLLVNEVNAYLADHQHTDLVIGKLDDLIGILEEGFVGKVGQGEEEVDTKSMVEEVLRIDSDQA
jgi:HAD superfamily hydrolase (TIGR01509 family)